MKELLYGILIGICSSEIIRTLARLQEYKQFEKNFGEDIKKVLEQNECQTKK